MPVAPKIIVALDFATDQELLAFLPKLNPQLCRVKIGSIMFTRYGPALVEKIISQGFDVFLDLKFHDIPQTVAGACRAAAEIGVWMVNVHISGGLAMLSAAKEAIINFPIEQRPLLIGVSVLTSLNDHDLKMIGYKDSVEATVLNFARIACQAEIDGIVCSGLEIQCLRNNLPEKFLLVVPGIRSNEDDSGDQKRTMTPQLALAYGANYLVIGRPITHAKDPTQVLSKMIGM